MSKRPYQLLILVVCFAATSSIGCRAGQASRSGGIFPQGQALSQPNFGQLGQRVGNIAFDRVINAGISRVISGGL